MKKGLAVTCAVLAAGMTTMLGADAANDKYYTVTRPYFYMSAAESEDYEILRSGAIYVDKSAPGANKDTMIDMELFLKDDMKLMYSTYGKVVCKSDELKLVRITGPVAKYGCSPYKKVPTDKSMSPFIYDDDKSGNIIGFAYHEITFNFPEKPWELTGENSDDYPMICFEAKLIQNADNGSYKIEYPKQSDPNNYVTIALALPVDEIFYPADYSPEFYVHASDRALGDVDGDGTITELDAEKAMLIYSNVQNTESVPEGEKQAADVNGDEKVDDEDAGLILEYCAVYKDKTPDKTLNEFIKSR